jgi:hypothetical protein
MNCLECNTPTKNPKFCSKSCAAKFNNKGVNRHGTTIQNCLSCNTKLSRGNRIYCSNECQQAYTWNNRKNQIEGGDASLDARLYKKYLIELHGNKCMECGWGKINETSGKVPIELEHIDGDHANNNLDNLKLLCPNCHSLTPTYKALNAGQGRHSRRERYKEGKSY